MSATLKLKELVNEMYSSQLVISERVISKLLAFIFREKELYAVVTDAATSSDYHAEYTKAVNRSGGYGINFIMPSGNGQIVTLVTGLLYDFDTKNQSIVDFVTRAFPSSDSRESYLMFCDKIIAPYADALIHFLNKESDSREADETPITFPDTAKEDAENWLYTILNKITDDDALNENDRAEFSTVIKGALYALELGNPILMKTVWIGLKNTLRGYKKAFSELNELYLLFKNYGVVS